MASIARDKNGTRRILVVASDGSRKTVYLAVPPRGVEPLFSG